MTNNLLMHLLVYAYVTGDQKHPVETIYLSFQPGLEHLLEAFETIF